MQRVSSWLIATFLGVAAAQSPPPSASAPSQASPADYLARLAAARIPADATVDLKLSGAYDRFFWSVGVNNLFNALYYDYAIASSFTPGRFAAYPLPGRTFMFKAGMTF